MFHFNKNLGSATQHIMVDYNQINIDLLQVLFSRIFLNSKMWKSFEDAKANNMFTMTVTDFEKYQAHMKTSKDTCDTDINGFIHQLVPIFLPTLPPYPNQPYPTTKQPLSIPHIPISSLPHTPNSTYPTNPYPNQPYANSYTYPNQPLPMSQTPTPHPNQP